MALNWNAEIDAPKLIVKRHIDMYAKVPGILYGECVLVIVEKMHQTNPT
jgi:hypothetical protein